MILFFRKYWLTVLLVLFLVLPLVSFLIGSAALFAYIHWPNQYQDMDFKRFEKPEKHIVVLAHGVKDDASGWIDPLIAIYKQNQYDGEVYGVDWSVYAKSSLRCAIEGKRIGELIGASIVKNNAVNSVQLIGHSCGSFVVYGACGVIKNEKPELLIQTTYLDPVSIYGPAWNYGLSHFGTCGDYSEAYIDTEDGVPGSNQLLPHTHTYDVTAIRKKSNNPISPHIWPTVYYQQLVKANQAPEFRLNRELPDSKPIGMLEQVE